MRSTTSSWAAWTENGAGPRLRGGQDEAVAEDEAAFEDQSQTFMEIPNALVLRVCELIATQMR